MFCLLKEGHSIFPFLLEKIDYNLSENSKKLKIYSMCNEHAFIYDNRWIIIITSLSVNAGLFLSNGVYEIHFVLAACVVTLIFGQEGLITADILSLRTT